ncbi:MAG: homocitrate synthase [Arcobacteraceae bacterium]
MALINDTTLRDGEQAPYVSFKLDEKLKIAQLLYEAGADELEVGIPAMGEKEQEELKEILNLNLPIPIMSWNRATKEDLEASLSCGVKAVDLSIPVSKILIDIKYKSDIDRLFRNLEEVITLAKQENLFVCIGGEDASRADNELLKEIMSFSMSLGANRFRYCDTVGILTPVKTYENISYLCSFDLLDIEIHTHNDFGMATANSIAAIEAGAKTANTTVIGLGERAGNASFEQVLMSLTHQFNENRKIDSSKLRELVKTVSKAANKQIDANCPIVGKHIFSHESGIHVNGMIKSKNAYEAFSPGIVGLNRYFPIGKHSGSATLLYHLNALGITPDKAKVQALLPQVRDIVTNRKKVMNSQELKELYLCS